MDFDASGTLYAMCERSDGSNTIVLITIDPSTGAGTEVGPTGLENLGDFSGTHDISFRPSDALCTSSPRTGRQAGYGLAR